MNHWTLPFPPTSTAAITDLLASAQRLSGTRRENYGNIVPARKRLLVRVGKRALNLLKERARPIAMRRGALVPFAGQRSREPVLDARAELGPKRPLLRVFGNIAKER